ncbi:MAG TPA: hypothetical protein VFE07_04945 [Marmoricola sp.]|nr:hypothetical protein [Marmoricola sp.]
MARSTLRSSLVGALALGLAACGSTTADTAPDARPSPSRTRTAATTPAKTTAYATRQQAKFLADGADGMVALAGALWVKTDLGHVVRIDPRTNKITADIVVDKYTGQSFYCQGIGAVRDAVWACKTRSDGIGVVRIDPSTGRVTRLVKVGKVFDQLALPSTSRGIWVLTDDGNSVSVVDPASGRVSTFPLRVRCQQLAAHGDRVVATAVAGSVVVLDAQSGAVVDRLSVNTPRMAAVVGDDIWVETADGLTRFSEDLRTRTVYPGMSAGQGGDVFSDQESVWLRESDGTIFRIDADSGKVLERIVPSPAVSAGSLVVAYGSIWTTGSEEGWVIRLSEDG